MSDLAPDPPALPSTLAELVAMPVYARTLGLLAEQTSVENVIRTLVAEGVSEDDAEQTALHTARLVARKQRSLGWQFLLCTVILYLAVLSAHLMLFAEDPGFPFRGLWPAARDLVFSALIARHYWKIACANSLFRQLLAD
jgi:hypothetical protein